MLTIKNKVRRNVVFLLTLALFQSGCGPPGPRALQQGQKLLERGRCPEALDRLRVAASLLATNAQAWNYLGVACHLAGQVTNAAQAYQKALALNYDLVEAHFNLGCLWLEQNRLETAKSELTTYTSLRKNSVEGWLKLGTAQLRLRDLAAAEKSFNEALRLSPSDPEAWNGLGLVQFFRNRPRDAAQTFVRTLKQHPDYPPALLNLAIVSQFYVNDHSLALQEYRDYLALTPREPDWEAVNATARELERELNPPPRAPLTNTPPPLPVNTNAAKPAAIAPAHAINPVRLEPAPNPPKAAAPTVSTQVNVGVVTVAPEPVVRSARDTASSPQPPAPTPTQSVAPSPTGAIESPKTQKPGFFSRINPLNLVYHDTKTGSLAAETPAAGANASRDTSSSALGSAPGGSARYRYRSPEKPKAGDHPAAERAFAQGLQAHQANRLAEAIQSYRQATQLDPAYYDAYYNLGLAASAAGNVPQSLAAYETALAVRPESVDARYNFSLALKQAGWFQDAANELERLLSTNPREPRARLALGNLYAQKLNQPAKARLNYQKALENDPHNPQAGAIRNWLMANPS